MCGTPGLVGQVYYPAYKPAAWQRPLALLMKLLLVLLRYCSTDSAYARLAPLYNVSFVVEV